MTFSRSPLWAPLARVARRCKEDACDKTSGEPVEELLETVIIMVNSIELVIQYRGTDATEGGRYITRRSQDNVIKLHNSGFLSLKCDQPPFEKQLLISITQLPITRTVSPGKGSC